MRGCPRSFLLISRASYLGEGGVKRNWLCKIEWAPRLLTFQCVFRFLNRQFRLPITIETDKQSMSSSFAAARNSSYIYHEKLTNQMWDNHGAYRQGHSPDKKILWNYIKHCKKDTIDIGTLWDNIPGELLTEPRQRAELLKDQFQSVFNTPPMLKHLCQQFSSNPIQIWHMPGVLDVHQPEPCFTYRQGHSPDKKILWNYIKHCKKDTIDIGTLWDNIPGELLTEPRQRAELLKDQFQSVFNTPPMLKHLCQQTPWQTPHPGSEPTWIQKRIVLRNPTHPVCTGAAHQHSPRQASRCCSGGFLDGIW